MASFPIRMRIEVRRVPLMSEGGHEAVIVSVTGGVRAPHGVAAWSSSFSCPIGIIVQRPTKRFLPVVSTTFAIGAALALMFLSMAIATRRSLAG